MAASDAALLAVIFALIGWALVLLCQVGRRRAEDVLCDLAEDQAGSQRASEKQRLILNDGLSAMGLYSQAEKQRFRLQRRLLLIAGALCAMVIQLLRARTELSGIAAAGALGLGLGYLAGQMLQRRKERRYIREIEFFLPLVMERVVMAVQAGLDIIPALKTIAELDCPKQKEGTPPGKEGTTGAADPVSRLVGIVCRLTEAGLSFEQALRDVAGMVKCAALRHAFIHLAVAQREGGELIMPLRELSDSTQLYYQESVEEEIAKMPVKATMPLLCTFAGLIIFFITSPMIQVLTMTMKAMPK